MSILSDIMEEEKNIYVFFCDSHHYNQFGIVDNIIDAEELANEIDTEHENGYVSFVIKGYGCDLPKTNAGILDFGNIKPEKSDKIHLVLYNFDSGHKIKKFKIENKEKVEKILQQNNIEEESEEVIEHVIIGKKLKLIKQKRYLVKE